MTDFSKHDDAHTAYLHARTFVLVTLSYFLALEAFNLFSLHQSVIVILTFAPTIFYTYSLYRYKIWKNVWFPVAISALVVVLLLGTGRNFLIHDSVNYHLPKILMQAASGNLTVSEGPAWMTTSTIALTDNIAMLFMMALKSERALLIPNLFCFFFIVFQGLCLIGQKRWPAIAIFLILLAAVPSAILETAIFKPNILAPTAFLLCLGTFYVRMAESKFLLGEEYILFGLTAAFLALTKVNVFLAVMPVCVAITAYALYRNRKNFTKPAIVFALSAVASIAILLPYIVRQYIFHGPALVADQSATWSILPPNLSCAFYFWPQHIMSILKFVYSTFGHDLTANITPSACWAGRDEYNEIRPLWYGHDLGMWLLAVAFFIRHRWSNWQTVAGAVLILAAILPMIHVTFYANSVFNSRMVGFDLVLIAFALAFAVAPTIRWFDIIVPGLISSYVALASFGHTGKNLDIFEKSNSRFEEWATSLSPDEPVIIGYYAKGYRKEAWSVSFAMLSIFDFYNYNSRNVDFVYIDDFREKGNITHLLLCSRGKITKVTWPKNLDKKFMFDTEDCRLQHV